MTMTVLVCGSRGATPESRAALRDRLHRIDHLILVHGDCRGPDRWSEDSGHAIEVRRHPADWNRHGKKAGFIRNIEMLERNEIDLVIAVWDGNSRGTAHMIANSVRHGVPVEIVPF